MLNIRTKQWLLFPVFLVNFLLYTGTAAACALGPLPTVLDEYERADVVMIARVVSLKKSTEFDPRYYGDVRSATMIVEKVFKGDVKVQDRIEFGQGNGIRCIWTFNDTMIGHEYLLYVQKPAKPSDLWYVWSDRSNEVLYTLDDLLYLDKMNKVRGKTRVSGTLDDENGFEPAGRRIRIIGTKGTYETKTDEHGLYELYDLPPGNYLIKPEMPDGWKIDREWGRQTVSEKPINSWKIKSFTLKPKKHAIINFQFKLVSKISGRVLAPSGTEMKLICVSLLQIEEEHRIGCSAITDERGRFQIDGVEAGTYVLVLNNYDPVKNKMLLPQFYYPNVTNREKATVITIRHGESMRNLDFRLSTADFKGPR